MQARQAVSSWVLFKVFAMVDFLLFRLWCAREYLRLSHLCYVVLENPNTVDCVDWRGYLDACRSVIDDTDDITRATADRHLWHSRPPSTILLLQHRHTTVQSVSHPAVVSRFFIALLTFRMHLNDAYTIAGWCPLVSSLQHNAVKRCLYCSGS